MSLDNRRMSLFVRIARAIRGAAVQARSRRWPKTAISKKRNSHHHGASNRRVRKGSSAVARLSTFLVLISRQRL